MNDLNIITDLVRVFKDRKDTPSGELHIEQITDALIYTGHYNDVEREELKKKANAALLNNMKRTVKGKKVSNPTSYFAKVSNGKKGYKKGVYKLRPAKQPKDIIPAQTTIIQNDDICKNISTSGVGKGGELAVMSELLFRGYKPALAVVDDGIDVFASNKDGKFFQIQVKTTMWKNNEAIVNIDKNSYAKYNMSNTMYIIVVRYNKNNVWINQYFIFTSSEIEKMIAQEFISTNEKKYSIKLKQFDGDIFASYKDKQLSVKYNLDNWELIK